MKIIQINASYKPAYVYGGPTMSVSKLCESLQASKNESSSNLSGRNKISEIAVFTTTANGTKELQVPSSETVFVDHVPVRYFKRITKDHTHFSPALLLALWKRLGYLREERLKGIDQRVKGKDQRLKTEDQSSNLNTQYSILNTNKGKRLKTKDQRLKTEDQSSNLNTQSSIVHIHAWWNLVSMLSCLVAVLRKTPVVLSPRGTLSSYSFSNRNHFIKSLLHRFVGLPLLKRCHFHVTTEKEKQDLLKLLTPRSITIIPNLVVLEKEEVRGKDAAASNMHGFSDQSVDHGILKLLFLSRIEEKKGLDLLLKELAEVNFPWTLSIAGDGKPEYIAELQELAVRLGHKEGDGKSESRKVGKLEDPNNNPIQPFNTITWLGHQDSEQKFNVLAAHNLLVLPSYDENFANVVIESLSVGTAVLVSEHVGLADYVSKNNLGWVCKTEGMDIQEKLELAYAENKKLRTIRAQAPQKIREDFSDSRLTGLYIDMYTKILQDV